MKYRAWLEYYILILVGVALIGMFFLSTVRAADLYVDGVLINSDVEEVRISTSTTPPPPDSVAITRFTAAPQAIDTGDSVTLSWASSNATRCTGTSTGAIGGWDGSAVLKTGSMRTTIAATGQYRFTLQCSGPDGPVSRTTLVTVTEPAGVCNPPLSGSVLAWKDLWHIDWPLPGYDTERVLIPEGGYRAIRFNTGSVQDHGGVLSVANTSSNGTRTGSISACKGEFNVPAECKHSWGSSGGIGWATDREPGYCQLAANTTYYLNITFTNGFTASSDTCLPHETCWATLQHINLE